MYEKEETIIKEPLKTIQRGYEGLLYFTKTGSKITAFFLLNGDDCQCPDMLKYIHYEEEFQGQGDIVPK